MLSKSASERLASLQLDYAQTLGTKLEQLRASWQQCLSGGWAESPGEDLRMQVHRVAGSAPSYGFSEIGGAAKSLEQCLRDLAKAASDAPFPDPGSEQQFVQLCRLLEEEERHFASAENGEFPPPVA